MEGTKLEMTVAADNELQTASYKAIPEADMEDEAITARPKNLLISNKPQLDGADEKMLPNEKDDLKNVQISPKEKQNGDAKLDIGDLKSAFVGMGKEELMKYANDPFWVRLRWFLFVTFWVLWAAMLVGAVLIIYAAPKCDPPPPRTWWQVGPISEIKDLDAATNFKALKEKGVQGVIVQWPGDAYEDLTQNEAFIKALERAKKEEFNVIVELDPSTSNVWFDRAEQKDAVYKDYYVWQASKGTESDVPNNWLTKSNQTAWKYSSTLKQFYYTPFDKPHLNFRNSNVTNEFSSVIRKLLEVGAAGIRVQKSAHLLVDGEFRDEEPKPKAQGFGIGDYGFYTHGRTENLKDLGGLLKQWRKVVKNATENGPFLVAEHLNSPDSFKVNGSLVVDLPMQDQLFAKNLNVTDLVNSLNYIFNIDGIDWPLWKGNSSVLPKDVEECITYLLPGAPLIDASDNIDAQLLKTRNMPSIMRGAASFYAVQNNTVLLFTRVASGNPGILVALNPLPNRVVINIPKDVVQLADLKEVTVHHYSSNYNETEYMNNFNVKKDPTSIPISPSSVIVLSYVPPPKKD